MFDLKKRVKAYVLIAANNVTGCVTAQMDSDPVWGGPEEPDGDKFLHLSPLPNGETVKIYQYGREDIFAALLEVLGTTLQEVEQRQMGCGLPRLTIRMDGSELELLDVS